MLTLEVVAKDFLLFSNTFSFFLSAGLCVLAIFSGNVDVHFQVGCNLDGVEKKERDVTIYFHAICRYEWYLRKHTLSA